MMQPEAAARLATALFTTDTGTTTVAELKNAIDFFNGDIDYLTYIAIRDLRDNYPLTYDTMMRDDLYDDIIDCHRTLVTDYLATGGN